MRPIRSFVLVVLVLLASALAAETVQPSLIFQTLHQSMWGPGTAAPPSERRFYIVNPSSASWNVSGSAGDFWGQEGFDFGAGVSGSTSGHVGLWTDLKIQDPGSVDVTYPVTPKVIFPDANSFRAGDTVAIKTSYALDSGWQMQTTSPQFQVELDGSFAFAAHADAKLCVFDCAEFDIVPSFNLAPGEFNIVTISPGDSISTPPWLDSPIGGTLTVPNISTTATLAGNGRSLSGEGSDEFLEVTLNLTDIASKAARIPFPLSYTTEQYPAFDDFTGIHVDYTLIDVEAYARLKARQRFHFDPDLKISLQFAQPLEHWVVSGGSIGPTMIASAVEMHVGDTLYVKYPEADKQPTAVDPTFRLDNEFESATGFDLTSGIDTNALAFHAKIPEIEIFPEICFPAVEAWGVEITPAFCTPAVEAPSVNVGFGPMFEHDQPLAAVDLGNIFDSSWQLGGFAPVTIDAFALDPENPIVNLEQTTGLARNLGGGHRQVAYAIDFGNGGDVDLSNVHLVADLASAFSLAHRYTVDQLIGCDVAVNPDFDGASNMELLAPNAALAVGEKARVILIVSVHPKPDPPVYTMASTDEGTSPLGTVVTKADSSDVLLGPGTITGSESFVLFGEHFVKLDAIANTFGHIGSNDFVEVKNGHSAIVAGDLRAGRTIKVQGEITADYAYAGNAIDVVSKAKLNLSGNKKYESQPVYTLNAPVPSTPLQSNVWVGDRQSVHLRPGYYGDVTVNAGASLSLERGEYSFRKLSIANDASVSVAGSTRTTIIHVLDPGEVRIGKNASVRATLNAPRANVTFEERSRLEGAATAKSITLREGASATYHFECDRLVDRDCDGSAGCSQF